MKELIGKRIKNIFLGEGSASLWFITDKGNVGYEACGDCCSESYFSDVNRLKNLMGEVVLDVNEVELMEEEYGHIEEEDCQVVYGWKIKTSKGEGLIVMRNESNGYYGGTAEHTSGEIPNDAIEIKNDFCSRDLHGKNSSLEGGDEG